jgi:hypothetical protein
MEFNFTLYEGEIIKNKTYDDEYEEQDYLSDNFEEGNPKRIEHDNRLLIISDDSKSYILYKLILYTKKPIETNMINIKSYSLKLCYKIHTIKNNKYELYLCKIVDDIYDIDFDCNFDKIYNIDMINIINENLDKIETNIDKIIEYYKSDRPLNGHTFEWNYNFKKLIVKYNVSKIIYHEIKWNNSYYKKFLKSKNKN